MNTLTTYGYDPVTGMQEPKATLCEIRAGERAKMLGTDFLLRSALWSNG